jgi:hypothetical protein
VVRSAVIVDVCSEFAGLQAAHSGHLVLRKVRKIGRDPFEGVCCDGVAVIVVRE